jgi:acyl-CoA thioesterase YciA
MHPWGEPALRLTLMPRDTNAWGTIFGGVILSYIDLAGGVEARKQANQTFVTVAMREVVFHEPVFVGDLVSFYTHTERVGRTSVTVKVIVEAIRGHEAGKRVKVTEAEAVYVAIDETRRPVAIRTSRGGSDRARPPAGEPGGSPASLLPLADPRSFPDQGSRPGGRGPGGDRARSGPGAEAGGRGGAGKE